MICTRRTNVNIHLKVEWNFSTLQSNFLNLFSSVKVDRQKKVLKAQFVLQGKLWGKLWRQMCSIMDSVIEECAYIEPVIAKRPKWSCFQLLTELCIFHQ